jgi:hypothetical protein
MAKQAEKKQELAVIDFTKFSVQQLPELQGKKEEIKAVIKANPVVEITDTASYELAKKSRTAVRTKRTSTETEKKDVKSKIKNFVIDVIDTEYDNLITELKDAEKERQDPITIWEDKKEQERLERIRLEQERIDGIKKAIVDFYDSNATIFRTMKFQDIASVKESFEKAITETDVKTFEEFEVLFNSKVAEMYILLDQMVSILEKEEENRLAQLRLEEERIDNERKDRIKNSISIWYNDWSLIIDRLVFVDCKDIFNKFLEEKALNCQEFASDFGEKRSLLVAKFETRIAQLQELEQVRIQKENQEAEAKKLEEQKLNFRFEQRKFELSKIGVLEFDQEMIKAISDEAFEVYLEDCKPKPIEEIEVVEPIEFEQLNVIDEEEVPSEKELFIKNDGMIEGVDFINLPTVTYEETKEKFENKLNEVDFEEIPEDPIRKTIFATIEDLCSDFLYYDRKEDEDLSAEELNQAVQNGIITVDEMVAEFRKHLENTFSKNG